MPDASRRFTDTEVALLLRKASEMDEAASAGAGGGLSIEDLRQIGREVGISPAAIDRAVQALEEGRRGPGPLLLRGAPLVRRAVRAVPDELGEDAIARLVRLIDERAEGAGEVTEALGSVRWTSSDRFHSVQVSITPAKGETTIQVVEKTTARLRRLIHLLPIAWGGILGGALMGSLGSPSGAAGAAILGLGGAAGAVAGRAVWAFLSLRSARRVERLAAELTADASAAARQGGKPS